MSARGRTKGRALADSSHPGEACRNRPGSFGRRIHQVPRL